MLIKNLLLAFVGLAGGIAISAGVFAFIIIIGVIPRIAGRTHTAWAAEKYENSVVIGGLIGNILYVFSLGIPVGNVGCAVYGFFSGMFVGCFAMALAEVLNVLPIFCKRLKLRRGLIWMVLAFAVGKSFGAWYQLFYPVWRR